MAVERGRGSTRRMALMTESGRKGCTLFPRWRWRRPPRSQAARASLRPVTMGPGAAIAGCAFGQLGELPDGCPEGSAWELRDAVSTRAATMSQLRACQPASGVHTSAALHD